MSILERIQSALDRPEVCAFAGEGQERLDEAEVTAVNALARKNMRQLAEILSEEGFKSASYYQIRSHYGGTCRCYNATRGAKA